MILKRPVLYPPPLPLKCLSLGLSVVTSVVLRIPLLTPILIVCPALLLYTVFITFLENLQVSLSATVLVGGPTL